MRVLCSGRKRPKYGTIMRDPAKRRHACIGVPNGILNQGTLSRTGTISIHSWREL